MAVDLSPQPIPDTTSTAQDVVDTQNAQSKPKISDADAEKKKRNEEFKQRVEVCKLYRRKLVANWTISIDYRRGKPFSSQTDEDQIAVNLDWSLTKDKQSALFSQVPQVRIDHPPQTLQLPWLKTFEQRLNDTLINAGIESCMEEVLPDVINAAGIGAAIVTYEAISDNAQVPQNDISTFPQEIQDHILQHGATPDGEEIPMDSVPRVLDYRYLIQRISPADLLWPINFTGSDFDRGPWIGRSGRVTWAQAQQMWNLTEDDKETVIGEDRLIMDRLTHDVERDKAEADRMVGFDEVFFWEFEYDAKAQSYQTIHHLVFVNGKTEPVVDEPWKGQKVGPDGKVQGCTRFPIRCLTLTYITDEIIPPSDSAIGRPQVNEINKARTQMIRQRERSLPIRWFDVNRIDPTIQQSLMRGTWQAMIPVQGDGTRSIGEVARANMPPENFKFDQIAKFDLREIWTVEPPQAPAGSPDQSGEPQGQPPSAFQTRLGRERARVASFFTSIAEVLGGLMCLFEDPQSLGQGFDPAFSSALNYSVLADSTVLLDANQRLSRLNQFVNLYAKSGWVNLEPVFREIATLSGLDPNLVIKAPEPKPPVEPNISLRLTGVEDLLNPLALAFMIKSGQAPQPQLIEQAKQLIQQAVIAPQGMQMPGQPLPPGGLPMLPAGGGGLPVAGAPPVGGPTPPPPPPQPGEAHPQMSAMPQINKTSEPGGKQ